MIPDYNLKSFKDLSAHSQKTEREESHGLCRAKLQDTAWLPQECALRLSSVSAPAGSCWGSLGHRPEVTLWGQLQGFIQMDKTGQKQINTAQHFISEETKGQVNIFVGPHTLHLFLCSCDFN